MQLLAGGGAQLKRIPGLVAALFRHRPQQFLDLPFRFHVSSGIGRENA